MYVCMYVWGEIYESPGKYKGVASSVLLATLLMRYILQFDEFFDAHSLFLQNFSLKKFVKSQHALYSKVEDDCSDNCVH